MIPGLVANNDSANYARFLSDKNLEFSHNCSKNHTLFSMPYQTDTPYSSSLHSSTHLFTFEEEHASLIGKNYYNYGPSPI